MKNKWIVNFNFQVNWPIIWVLFHSNSCPWNLPLWAEYKQISHAEASKASCDRGSKQPNKQACLLRIGQNVLRMFADQERNTLSFNDRWKIRALILCTNSACCFIKDQPSFCYYPTENPSKYQIAALESHLICLTIPSESLFPRNTLPEGLSV